MTLDLAQKIKELRTGRIAHSWRRIAEVISDSHPEAVEALCGGPVKEIYGHQWVGEELCDKAASVLQISKDEYQRNWVELEGWVPLK